MLTRFGEFDRMWGGMDEFRRRMGRLFDEYDRGGLKVSTGWPRTNTYDNGESIVLRAEIPGLSRDEVDIQVHANVVSIAGERKSDAPEGYSVHRRERAPVKFSRSFSLPVEVDTGKVTATLKDGILNVTLPKTAQALPRRITIKAD